MTVFLSGCVYAGKFAIQFRASLNLDLAYHRGEPLFPASPRSPRISGQVFSKLASRCSPRSSTPPMRCWASGHVSAAPNEVKASRSRSVGGNETCRCRDGTPVEGGDPARERVHEAVQLGVWKCPVDVSVSFRGVTIEVVRSENDFQRATAADQMGEALGTAATGMQSDTDFGLAESRVLARREAHVAGEDELAAHAPDAASDLRDADHRGLGETHERIRQDREAGSPDSCHDVSYLAGQVKVGKVEPRIRAFEYYDPQARAGVHPSEQILETFEYGGVYNVERRIFEKNPPVRRRFLDDPHVRRHLSHDSLSVQ